MHRGHDHDGGHGAGRSGRRSSGGHEDAGGPCDARRDDHAERHAQSGDHHHQHGRAGTGHNHEPHLHSHVGAGTADHRAALQALADAFIDGFRNAGDKVSYLRLAEVPFSLKGADGLEQRLVDVAISTGYQVATASPGFGTRELVYLPFPGEMVRERTSLTFVYVSLTTRRDVDLVDFLAQRFGHGPSIDGDAGRQ